MRLGMPPRLDGRDIASALEEVSTGLGYIVGRRASMPEGARVRIDLTGPVSRTFLVQVEGRAVEVESFDQPPTVGDQLPVTLFLRLTGGRDDLHRSGEVEIGFTGDRSLGEQLVANLASPSERSATTLSSGPQRGACHATRRAFTADAQVERRRCDLAPGHRHRRQGRLQAGGERGGWGDAGLPLRG